LDRLVKGIADADIFTVKKIRLVIVGDGPAIPELKDLVSEQDLGQQVTFVGEKIGAELDKLFDNADVGIGTLGIHRKNIKIDSSLKHRGYAARGLAFILCTKDMDFPRSHEYVKYYDETEKAIDIESLLAFGIKMKQVDPNEIRKYAEKKLSWEAKTNRILEEVHFD